MRAVEHDCGIHCSGRPLTLAFPAPTLQLRQITVLVLSTEMRLSDTLMGAYVAAEKTYLDASWLLSNTSAVLCSFQNALAKGDRGTKP